MDVRSKPEIELTGKICDDAVNVPLAELSAALNLPSKEFSARLVHILLSLLLQAHSYGRYGFEKPRKSDAVVFTCAAGVRSGMASRIAEASGYKKYVLSGALRQESHSTFLTQSFQLFGRRV